MRNTGKEGFEASETGGEKDLIYEKQRENRI